MSDFERYLSKKVQEGIPSKTKEAMAYSLMNGGKRVRPQIVFALLKDYGCNIELGYPCACGIEMIHTYSLIHDDLPCMDDDDLRRGKPSCHKAFSEATAVLAGDGLLTQAFRVLLESNCSDTQKCQMVQAFSEYAGIDGMILGQDMDMAFENNREAVYHDLEQIEIYKTGRLLTLPMICACILAGRNDDRPIWEKIGTYLGILFQVQDDILDQTSTSEALGKSTSDEENHKLTAVSILGLQSAKELVLDLEKNIKSCLKDLSTDCPSFIKLIDQLMNRTY